MRPVLVLLICLFVFFPAIQVLAGDGDGVSISGDKAVPRTGVPEGLARRDALMNAKAKGKVSTSAQARSTARGRVMSEAARTLGFQEGFKYRYEKIYAAANARASTFDRIFDFRRLLIDDKVLPPVIRWAGPSMKLESEDFATEVEEQYRIVAPARIVSKAPTWQSYLVAETEVLAPADEIFPQNSDERKLWSSSVLEGWEEGEDHAYTVFEIAMNRLVADFRGILRFRMLAERGLVSVPVLAKGDLGIQIGKNVLNMDQKTFRITVPAEFRLKESLEPKKPEARSKAGRKGKKGRS